MIYYLVHVLHSVMFKNQFLNLFPALYKLSYTFPSVKNGYIEHIPETWLYLTMYMLQWKF